MARPKGVTAPQKERLLEMIDGVYGELNATRARAAEWAEIIDQKNKEIKKLKGMVPTVFKDELHEWLTIEMAYGKLLRQMRLDAGLTLEKMGRLLHVSMSQLHKMEHGDVLVSRETIVVCYEKARELKQRGELHGKNQK